MSTEFLCTVWCTGRSVRSRLAVKVFQLSTAAGRNSPLISHGVTTAEIQLQKRKLRYFKQVKYLAVPGKI